MRRFAPLTVMLLMLAQVAFAATPPNPRLEVERRPGDIDGAVKHLGDMLRGQFRKDVFAELNAGRVVKAEESVRYAARRILALHRMGKVSVHSLEVKNAFVYEFLTTYADPTRLHEALAIYERIAVANSDDPMWRMIRARCARLMDLPETLKLYDQVAADMTGVPGDEEVRKAWQANREEFTLPVYMREAWAKQITKFVYDAKGPDVPGSPPIKGSPFPLIDVAGVVGSKAAEWTEALAASPSTHAEAIDGFYAHAEKHGELPWLNGRGFLNADRAIASHLLTKPAKELAALRTLQDAAFKTATAGNADSAKAMTLFRRYPWSVSAQRVLLAAARKHVFDGEPHAAFRSFQDVLRHAEDADLRGQAQVGLWVSLSQFSEPVGVARAFDGVAAEATWPWCGKREKTDAIKRHLLKKEADAVQSPSLASLKPHTVRLPPIPVDSLRQVVLSVDMQRNDDQLLISSESMLAMYNATNPTKPVWCHTRRLFRHTSGGKHVLPQFVGKQVVARWGGESSGDYRMVAFDRSDGTVVVAGDPHEPYSRFRYRSMGRPIVVDNKVYTVQYRQTLGQMTRGIPNPSERIGDLSLSTFGVQDLSHGWSRTYEVASSPCMPLRSKSMATHPVVSKGAVYFCSNSGHVVRADCRDGEMEWVHIFRPVIGDNYRRPPSPWCLGAAPVVTEDKVICMPKFTGYLFALYKETGRRIWRTPLLRGHELLGVRDGLVLVVAANSLYGIDVNTGKLRWGRQIAPVYADGFQLPRAQLVGSSIYCGTKNLLYRFDARNGALLESRPWGMGKEVPMSFLVAGANLYAISDLPIKDATRERQLVEYHTVIYPAGLYGGSNLAAQRKDGSMVIWRDGMLICIKGDKVLWSRFVSNAHVYGGRMSERSNQISMSWRGGSAVYDATTGVLLSMRGTPAPTEIKIGGK